MKGLWRGTGPACVRVGGRIRVSWMWALVWASSDPLLSSSIPIYEADVTSVQLLVALCKKIKLLVSCVGRHVLEACVESGVDYLDITGEPEFMEEMEHLYHDKALQIGSTSFPYLIRIFFYKYEV